MQGLEGVGPARALADPLLHPTHVVDAVVGLNLGDHPHLGHPPGDLGAADNLSVDHPEAALAGWVGRRHPGVEVEQVIDRLVADGVHLRPQTGGVGTQEQAFHVAFGLHHRPPAAALAGVQVGLVEARRGVAHDAVDEALEAADLEHLVAEAVADAERRQVLPAIEGRAGIDPYRQLAAALELGEYLELFRRGDVVDAGDAVAAQALEGDPGLGQALLEGFRWYHRPHLLGGLGAQTAGRLGLRLRPFGATRLTLDARPVAVRAGGFQGSGVGQVEAAVPLRQQHRVVGGDPVDHRTVGEEGVAPAGRFPGRAPAPLLVGPPVAADDPGARRQPVAGRAHRFYQAGLVGDRQQVDPQDQLTGLVEVGVVVDEAGGDEAPRELDHPGLVATMGEDGLGVADRQDLFAAHRDRLRPRPVGVAGPHPGAGEDQAGVAGLGRPGRQQTQDQERLEAVAHRDFQSSAITPTRYSLTTSQ